MEVLLPKRNVAHVKRFVAPLELVSEPPVQTLPKSVLQPNPKLNLEPELEPLESPVAESPPCNADSQPNPHKESAKEAPELRRSSRSTKGDFVT